MLAPPKKRAAGNSYHGLKFKQACAKQKPRPRRRPGLTFAACRQGSPSCRRAAQRARRHDHHRKNAVVFASKQTDLYRPIDFKREHIRLQSARRRLSVLRRAWASPQAPRLLWTPVRRRRMRCGATLAATIVGLKKETADFNERCCGTRDKAPCVLPIGRHGTMMAVRC